MVHLALGLPIGCNAYLNWGFHQIDANQAAKFLLQAGKYVCVAGRLGEVPALKHFGSASSDWAAL